MDLPKLRQLFLADGPNSPLVAEVLVLQLGAQEEVLPDSLRAAILARGQLAVPPLLRLVDEDAILDDWAPLHALRLLADLGAVEAVEPMLRILAVTLCTDPINELAAEILPRFGQHVVEPALTLLEEEPDHEVLFAVCEVLSRLGVRDERIFEVLRRAFAESYSLGAAYFRDYGDPRALALINDALEGATRDPFSLRALVHAQRSLTDRPGRRPPRRR